MTPTTHPHPTGAGPKKEQTLQLDSICPLQVVVRRSYDYLGHLRADVESVVKGSMPLDALQPQPDVLLLGSGPGRFGYGAWAVRVSLTGHQTGTSITLQASADDPASGTHHGRRATTSLASSAKKMETLARLFQVMEEEAQMQRLDRP
ncbi:hypothetical protein [Micrococcus sp. TA1]|uniref:hypothetical protein n=1 Tax=Micrococcus sp. TA1 TaxID=681627 RepID=UPI0016119C3F|nr:hypothetical protein [Micrococcus sp. TA1]MBB5747983.1 hypothetical protein [Micrococcus sp. TA1]